MNSITLYGPENVGWHRLLSRWKGCIRTTSAPYWTRKAWRSAPGIIAAQPLMDHLGVPATRAGELWDLQ